MQPSPNAMDREFSHSRKAVEQELEEFFTFFETSSDLMCIADISGHFKALNPSWEMTLGYSNEELISKPYVDFIHPDDKEKTLGVIQQNLKLGIPLFNFENRYRCKDGTYKWFSWRSNSFPEKEVTYAIAHDITERKQMELEREQYYTFFKTSSDMMCIADPNGAFISVNPACTEILGYSEAELASKPFIDFIHPDDKQKTLDEMARQQKIGSSLAFENRYICKDGSCCWLSWGAVYNKDENRTYAIARDITDRKKLEEENLLLEQQLQHAQKLESLGVLAGGIAHDFNNILTSIIGNADLALMKINPESPVIHNLHNIEQAASRAADLAKQMLAYSGKGKFVIKDLDLSRLLEEMLHMLEVSISKKAVLRLNLSPNLPPVEADATQMHQIIMNLVINASEAIGDKSGVIAITTGCMDCDKSYLEGTWLADNIDEGLYDFLEITDTGCGMSKETMAKIFDPFFTTKFTGRGLGMSAVMGIVRGHKGAIRVYSEPNKGTTFKILLPASAKPVELFNIDSSKNNWKGEGKVLLVDDEETVRGIGKEMLAELGFTTITANDGREAIEIFKQTPDIVLVILDLTMPHVDGEQCFRELKRLKSDVKIIMSSGFNEQEVTQKFAGKGLAGFIQKPYKLSMLKDVIQKNY
ncbi:MAG: PAS domain S-box protein [Oryzomonas sp.]|uniref:PAS domain-containing hybrid sensor histidine kinase/response regulator n=1 Tax=Oryzomonas sp. TaxID=2855186 RepID=UPI002846F0BD|nr:PAS domain S-box protein [Oryzomonas sp.]MDR3581408.1 PAS domain S-box protein [Oryzomonas sp.]